MEIKTNMVAFGHAAVLDRSIQIGDGQLKMFRPTGDIEIGSFRSPLLVSPQPTMASAIAAIEALVANTSVTSILPAILCQGLDQHQSAGFGQIQISPLA